MASIPIALISIAVILGWVFLALLALGNVDATKKWLDEPGRKFTVWIWIVALSITIAAWQAPEDTWVEKMAPEITGIAFTITILERVTAYRGWIQYKREILDQVGSTVNDAALEAVRIAGLHGWLQDGSLRGANLIGTNLKRADLRGASLKGADLSGANLQGAQLNGAKLNGVILTGANLQGAQLRCAVLDDAVLEGADLSGVNLEHARLNRAKLFDAELKEAELQQAILVRADLSFSRLTDAILDEANLVGASLDKARGLENLSDSVNSGNMVSSYVKQMEPPTLDGAKYSKPVNLGFTSGGGTSFPAAFDPDTAGMQCVSLSDQELIHMDRVESYLEERAVERRHQRPDPP